MGCARSADEEAAELTEKYLSYFAVNTDNQKKQLDDVIEELLSHLEEFCATVELVRQHSVVFEPFLLTLVDRHKQMRVLFRQIDALDAYLTDTNKRLDELETKAKHFDTGSANRIKQIFSKIPGLSKWASK